MSTTKLSLFQVELCFYGPGDQAYPGLRYLRSRGGDRELSRTLDWTFSSRQGFKKEVK